MLHPLYVQSLWCLLLSNLARCEESPIPFNFSPPYETDQPLMIETLNPWLMADGGLILRAVTNNVQGIPSLNWLRPNPSKCDPKPAVPACISDRYCRIPESPRKFTSDSSKSRSGAFYRDSDDYDENLTNQRADTILSSSNKKRSDFSKGEQQDYEEEKAQKEKQQAEEQCFPYLSPGSYSYGNNSKDPSAIECICGHLEGEKRIDTLRKYHLHHCYHYSLWHVLSATMREGITMSRPQCYANLEAIQRLDNLAAHFVCQFEDIIRRYDCGQTFSSKSSCQQCKNAYRQWVCSMIIPMWLDGVRVKPCRSFCHEVERLCPYFLPAEKTGPGSQYAGEPSFLCIDPDVRETTNQSLNSAYNDRSCYRPCTLDFGLEPEVDPSLCVTTLGDIPAYTDEENSGSDQTTGMSESCQQFYFNRTEGGIYDNDDIDGEYGAEIMSQCKSVPTAPTDAIMFSNSALKLLDYWTKLLPLTALIVLLV